MPLKNFIKHIFNHSADNPQQPPPLDGEIVYSKNNVCVHPPGPLANAVEHYPGYLTVFAKITDESTSLVLNWIPNKRLKHGENPVQDSPIVPTHSKTLACTDDINPSLLQTSNPAVGKQENHILEAGELPQSVAPSQSSVQSNRSSLPQEEPELSDASISSGTTEGPDSDNESSVSYEIPDLPEDSVRNLEKLVAVKDTIKEVNLSLSSIDIQDQQKCRQNEDEEKLSSMPMKLSNTTDRKREEHKVSKTTNIRCIEPINCGVFPVEECKAQKTNHLDLPQRSPDCPVSPPAVYNMQFPENSISFVSQPSSSNSSNSTTPMQFRGYVKRPAKDQACGVFTVDLSQMRSLRLFFSNDVCNSGQLVIASQESQYKILHFHHGGLDSLASILEDWKFCVKQNEKLSEHVAVRHFSICGPQLAVGQCHPEEGLYRCLSSDSWSLHVNEFGQIEDEYNIRKAVFFGGMDASLRSEVWPFLLKYYPFSSTEFERQQIMDNKCHEYEMINLMRQNMSEEEKNLFNRSVACIVEKDVLRTDRANPYYRGDNNPNLKILRNILLNYAVYSKTGYTQGMSDLLSPLLIELNSEPETFWCFVGLMQRTIFISSPKDDDMEKQLMYLRELLRLMQPQFYGHLLSCGTDAMELLFVHRWILLCFKREFVEHEALMMWEACWAHYQTDYFHLFLCVAIIALYGLDVIENKLASDEMLLHFSNLSMQMNGQVLLRKARGLLHQFRVMPRVPCTLYDICMTVSPGVWDSGYTPVIECTTMHKEGECVFGGSVIEKKIELPRRKDAKIFNFFRQKNRR